jgi:hypothetical protein
MCRVEIRITEPSQHLFSVWMIWPRQGIETVCVHPDSAGIIRGTSPCSREATSIGAAAAVIPIGIFNKNIVDPAVDRIIDVRKSLLVLDGGDCTCVGITNDGGVTVIDQLTVPDPADLESERICALPTHGDLDNSMKLDKPDRCWHLDSTPDLRFQVAKSDLEPIERCLHMASARTHNLATKGAWRR